MPLYIGDYMRDTAHLSATEHGAYMLLLMHAWTHGGALPAAPQRLCIIGKLDAKAWKQSGPVLTAFFARDGDVLRQKRLDEELAIAQSHTEQRRSAGKISGQARTRKMQNTGNETPGNEQREVNERSTSVATGGPTKGQRNARPSPSPSPKKGRKSTGLRPEVILADDHGGIPPPLDGLPEAKPGKAKPNPTEIVEWAVTTWNRVCGGKLSPVVKITPNRRDAFLRRWREDFGEDAEQWQRFCERVAASNFLTNAERKNRADWRANFDFVLEPRNLIRIVEGLWDPPPVVEKHDPWAWVDKLNGTETVGGDGTATEFDLEATPDEQGTFRPH
jgi:uncharacterized protein YdaU (DUF1376 family)